jgi:uncharacterized membrane protein YfcA
VENIYLLAFILTGLAIGIISGLLGVGGGFLMVPVQYWAMTSSGIDPTIAMRVAFGTSLAVILPTALSGCYGHSCRGCVLWNTGLTIGLSGLIGSFLGGTIASHLPAQILQMIFGFMVLAGALRLLFSSKISPSNRQTDNRRYYIVLGFLAGFFSGLSGIGGGIILVPILFAVLRLSMIQSIGTSTLVISLNSVGGIIAYAINGWGVPGLPPYSIGYINLLQLGLIAGSSVPATQLGVRLAHRWGDRLRYIFIALMIYISLRALGLLDWLSL